MVAELFDRHRLNQSLAPYFKPLRLLKYITSNVKKRIREFTSCIFLRQVVVESSCRGLLIFSVPPSTTSEVSFIFYPSATCKDPFDVKKFLLTFTSSFHWDISSYSVYILFKLFVTSGLLREKLFLSRSTTSKVLFCFPTTQVGDMNIFSQC